MALDVGALPFRVAIECPAWPNEWCLGSERNQLGAGRAPEVEHHLAVARITHQAAEVPLALHVYLVAIDGNDGNVLARPVGRFQHFCAGHDVLLDAIAACLTLANDGELLRVPQRAVGFVQLGIQYLAVAQLHDGLHVLVAHPMLGNAHRVFIAPQAVAVIAVCAPVAGQRVLAVLGFELRNRHQVGDKPEAPVASIRCRAGGVGINRQRVGNALNLDVEIKRIFVRVVRGQTEVAEARVDRRFQRGVVGHVSIAALLDVAD